MNVTHIYALPNGDSTFSDLEINLIDQGKFGFMSEPYKGSGLIFREMPQDYDSGWHVVPQALYLVILEGQIKISVGTGQKRVLGPGSVLFAEDTVGGGHRTQSISSGPIKSLLYKLD
jgi:mannose-6-phosphate isomerase-like protein (cupin superfamily)